MRSFGEKNSLVKTFLHGYCKDLNMKLNIWLKIRSKYMEGFYEIVCVIVGIIFRKTN